MEILFCYTERTAYFVLMVLFADPKYSNMTCHTSCSGGSEKKMFLDKKGFCSPESGSVVSAVGNSRNYCGIQRLLFWEYDHCGNSEDDFPDPRRKLFLIQKHFFVYTDCVRLPVRYAEVPNDVKNSFPYLLES
jgi:hypothetical protein